MELRAVCRKSTADLAFGVATQRRQSLNFFLIHKEDYVNRILTAAVFALMIMALIPSMAFATPSTTYWAPSTANCQAKGVPHITYDTYFGKGTPPPGAGAPA